MGVVTIVPRRAHLARRHHREGRSVLFCQSEGQIPNKAVKSLMM